MKHFVGIVDGTGPYGDLSYATEMKASFCSQLAEACRPRCHYLRGPSGEGYYIETRAREIVERTLEAKAERIFLAGYSRGGSIVVIAARMLAEYGRQVDGLFLFDPVARHMSASSDLVPANVLSVYTARRLIGDRRMDKYDFKLLGNMAGHNPVRNWFGTTATKYESPRTKHVEAHVLGSHGALGGVGWRDVAEDQWAQQETANFFNQAFAAENLPAQINAGTPSSAF